MPAARVERVLAILRSAGPPGLGAADLADCLLLQLAELPRVPAILPVLVRDHLADLARGRLAAVAAALGVGTAEVREARGFLRTRLRPWVALDEPGDAPPPAPPDVVLRWSAADPEALEVEVAGSGGMVRLAPDWASLAAGDGGRLSAAERRSVRTRTARARQFLAELDERAGTLARIARYAAERQRPYLRRGAAAQLPLTRAEVAAALGLHESTVSRAVAGKRVRRPDGVTVDFAALFGAAGPVEAALRALVDAEPRPLSDTELAGELTARGHAVARRTVAKYRGRLGIPAAAAR